MPCLKPVARRESSSLMMAALTRRTSGRRSTSPLRQNPKDGPGNGGAVPGAVTPGVESRDCQGESLWPLHTYVSDLETQALVLIRNTLVDCWGRCALLPAVRWGAAAAARLQVLGCPGTASLSGRRFLWLWLWGAPSNCFLSSSPSGGRVYSVSYTGQKVSPRKVVYKN